MTTDPHKALTDIQLKEVDIVLADLLMPELSGIDLVKQVKGSKPSVRFIMISKVQDSELRAKAYQAGIEFFINKPVNIIEVQAVIKKVEQSVKMANQLSSISAMVNQFNSPQPPATSPKKRANMILKVLGMATERGSSDILKIITLMNTQQCTYRHLDLDSTLKISDHDRKIMEQRMRRAIRVGLVNLANQLLDNPDDEQLRKYANTLFGYENVHRQILYQQNQVRTGGRITIQMFMDGLFDASQD